MVKSIDDCIDLIQRLSNLEDIQDQDINECFKYIYPFLTHQYGTGLTEQIQKLVNIKAFDRVIMLLNSVPKKRIHTPLSHKFKQTLLSSFFIILIAAAAISFFIIGIINVINSKNSDSWPSTDGIITKSRIGRESRLDENSFHDFADIMFSYSVNGKQYKSCKISYSLTKNPAHYIEKYPEGKKVNVYYNSKNPEISVLEPGFSSITYMWFGGGILLLIFFFFSLRLRRN